MKRVTRLAIMILNKDSLQPITVKVEAIDEYGLMSEEQITISPSDPGWNVTEHLASLIIDVDEAIEFTFFDNSSNANTNSFGRNASSSSGWFAL